jgi:hypothetical protein
MNSLILTLNDFPMKTLPKMEISDELDAQIDAGVKFSDAMPGFEAPDLPDVLRASIPGFPIFALFYRWNGATSLLSHWNLPRRICPPSDHPLRRILI